MGLGRSVHHIVPRIHSEASGTTYVVPRLTETLHQLGVDAHLHVIRAAEQAYNFPLHIHKPWPGLERLGASSAMKRALNIIAAQNPVIIHNHSLWMMPNVYAGAVRKRNRKSKLVVSPHGTLSEFALQQSKLKKWAFDLLFRQKTTLEQADLIHATSETELEDVRRFGILKPVALIPVGIDFTKQYQKPALRNRSLLFLGRLHPIKGLDNLIDAWSKIEKATIKDWQLIIAGPEGKAGYLNTLMDRIRQQNARGVNLIGPVYGEDKQKLLAEVDVFVMPSHSENFNVTIAEALYQSTPVVASRQTPWGGLENQECGWWIDNDTETLKVNLENIISLPSTKLQEMGRNGYDWVKRDFGWQETGNKMKLSYEWLLGQKEKPDWIITD